MSDHETGRLDLFAELDNLVAEAREAQRKLAAGEAKNGASALRRIEVKASDVARWARAQLSDA